MNFTLTSKEKNEAKFTMAFAAEDFDKALNAAYQANKSKFVVDGFRKGKAPRSIIESKYGADAVTGQNCNLVAHFNDCTLKMNLK